MLLFTDSLCYEIKSENLFQDIKGDIEKEFDTADFPRDHILYSEMNKLGI
jgi:hypothetical protein